MKKVYCSPEWEILVMEEDLITTSGEFSYGDDRDANSDSVDDWVWGW